VCILDADKEGFLRSVTSLIQTAGRAARNAGGKVIMYADTITPSMQVTIDETSRRRKIQEEYNEEHGITPKTIVKSVREVINTAIAAEESIDFKDIKDEENEFTKDEINEMIDALKPEMYRAAEELDFEKAAEIRDKIKDLREKKKSAVL
ncbi:MAG: UvrB/UvrC motif-containing protein, partial [Peptoniphilus harei]|nr:UvrB/UvrC motif-containing protein [Peptoniphilus harei]